MQPFLTDSELRGIQMDAEQLLQGPEATPIILEYSVWNNAGDMDIPDAAYGINDRARRSTLMMVTVHGIQKIITARHTTFLQTGLVQVGDCIFYCSLTVNFDQPDETVVMVPDTMILIDPSGQRWKPDPVRTQSWKAYSQTIIGGQQITQEIITFLEKQ